MHVVATAGHVDHGKSTLVRALTGMEPDRWAEERRRGMTLDLGYAWTTLPSGRVLGLVDVPGHARFIGNMLAGLGPAPAVLFVVAADEGWCRQSTEHLAAVHALGLTSAVLAVTRSDLADPTRAAAEAVGHLRRSTLTETRTVAVSAVTGEGMGTLRSALDDLCGAQPAPDLDAPVRLWVDRAFTVRGSGTVVTGTLSSGTLRVGDELVLRGSPARVRALQSLGTAYDEMASVARVAVNLRGVERSGVERGDVLLTPGVWTPTRVVDVRLSATARDLPRELQLHVGTTSVTVHVRRLGADTARLRLPEPLALRAGDRALLRDPAAQRVLAGITLLDADPPALARRGAAAARARALEDPPTEPEDELRRRGAVPEAELIGRGIPVGGDTSARRAAGWLVDPRQWQAWMDGLGAAVDRHAEAFPLEPGLPVDAAGRAIELPEPRLLAPLADAAGLLRTAGRIRRPGRRLDLGAAESGVQSLEQRLQAEPFSAPDLPELAGLGLGPRELAAAERDGRLLRVSREVVLLPDAPARALEVLLQLPQPFTLGAARSALRTSRRVAVPLLEHLDRTGATRRLDASRREVRST